MKVVVLAGGLGTRLAEETEVKPKPMVDIGGHPILWHILKGFAHHDLREFVVALGYKGEVIKRWLVDHVALAGSMTVDLRRDTIERHARELDDWLVHLAETGQATNTGGRLRRLRPLLKDERFIVTYGDGVSDVDVKALVAFHKEHGRLATITAVRPPARYGGLFFDGPLVSEFTEKPQVGEGWINGGYMVLEPAVLDLVDGDATSLEAEVLERLAKDRQLAAYRHPGFWQCMDTLRDKRFLDGLWSNDRAPWKVWS
jgi:glucose-1-phosphate cytidylyltransferase